MKLIQNEMTTELFFKIYKLVIFFKVWKTFFIFLFSVPKENDRQLLTKFFLCVLTNTK